MLTQANDDGRVFVRDVPPGPGAAEAGLTREDEVLLVDGRDVRSMSPLDLHLALIGKVGTSVRLTIWRRGRIERLVVVRSPLEPR